MKMLTTLTIAMAVPTIVFSLWGQTPLPFQDDPEGFYEVIGVALVSLLLPLSVCGREKRFILIL